MKIMLEVCTLYRNNGIFITAKCSLKVCSLFSKEGGRYNNEIHNNINECKMCRHFGILTFKDVLFSVYVAYVPSKKCL